MWLKPPPEDFQPNLGVRTSVCAPFCAPHGGVCMREVLPGRASVWIFSVDAPAGVEPFAWRVELDGENGRVVPEMRFG